MDEGYCHACIPQMGVPARCTPFGSEVRNGSTERLAVSKCFPVCPESRTPIGVLNCSPKGGPPMMRGEQHETHDRCNDSPDDVSSRGNSGASNLSIQSLGAWCGACVAPGAT